ncbi:MAG: hypothetical protein A2017_05310 [Lentisphaerae bacterium GWF2_44_16]|nr:MAG: hypothetical protein A2017_05310 [Lentisphaerae bacterium GWF2_44_16]
MNTQKNIKADECLNMLRTNSVFWSKLGFCYDPPRMNENGKPIVFFEDFERFSKYHKDFVGAGVKIHTSILFSGWVGANKYDYELTDNVLDALFKDNPDIYYIPRIKLNVPIEWSKENPEELCVYYEGPREVGEIKKLVGTLKHDLLGYDSEKGYYTAGGWQDDRPNVGGLISNQSFSSKKWLKDAGEVLIKIIEHLENGPYSDRILAYHIGYGACAETCLWGRVGGKFGDYGIAHRKAFSEWIMKKYNTIENVRRAWAAPELTEDKIEVPPPELRERKILPPENKTPSLQIPSSCPKLSLKEFFRASPEMQICVDYDKFMSDVNADAIEFFGKIIKEHTGGKAVGSFYGYFLEVSRSAYTGHLAFERLLNSPYLDFIAAPKSYYRNGPGDPGGVLAPAQSVNLKKLWLDELDNRTHLCKTPERQCRNFAETRTVMWREFSKNLAYGSGFWWMDLGGGWFDAPEIILEVQKIEKFYHSIGQKKHKSISEILLVVDEEALFHVTENRQFHNLLMKELLREFQLCGTPIDIFRLKDLKTMDTAQYKLICFFNTFILKSADWADIHGHMSPNTNILWFYTPGIYDNTFSLDNVESLTGFRIVERAENPNVKIIPCLHEILQNASPIVNENISFPLIEICNGPKICTLAEYSDGGIALGKTSYQNRIHILSAFPLLRTKHLRIIAEQAGVFMYADIDNTVYADNRFTAVFPKSGSYIISEK